MLSIIVQMKFKKYGYSGKNINKWKKNHIYTPRFFLRQVTCNSFRYTVILLEGIALTLKYINRIMYRIIQGVITPGYALFTCLSWNVQGLLKRSILLQPFHMKLQWLNCVWKVRLRKIKISFIWVWAVKHVCKLSLSILSNLPYLLPIKILSSG